jgi:hypothetical protein
MIVKAGMHGDRRVMLPLPLHRVFEFIAPADLVRPHRVISLDGHMLGSRGVSVLVATSNIDMVSVAWDHDRPALHLTRRGKVSRELAGFASRLFQVTSCAIAAVGWLTLAEAKVGFPELLDGLTQDLTPSPTKELAGDLGRIIHEFGWRDPMVTLATGFFTEIYLTMPDQRTLRQVEDLESRLSVAAGYRVRVVSSTSELGWRMVGAEGFPLSESVLTDEELDAIENHE